MLAEELRIGNLVYNSHGDIHAIGCNCFHRFRYPSMDGNPSGFKPIPLTEEILLKCGATVDGIEHIIKARALPIKIRFHSGIAYCEFGNVYLGDRIKHLHQLQNLYYALCGGELEVKI